MNRIISKTTKGLIALIVIICVSGCSPEEKIRKDLDEKVEHFKNTHPNYSFSETSYYFYNIEDNVNYLADERVRKFAFDYVTYKVFKEEAQNKYQTRDISYYDSLATDSENRILKILPKVGSTNVGGIWVICEINYSEYYRGNCTNRRLYLYSSDGEFLLYENGIQFDEEDFEQLLWLTNTNINTTAQSDYNMIRNLIIAFVVVLSIFVIYWIYKRKEPQRIQKKQLEEERKQALNMQRKKAAEENWKRWKEELANRAIKYGELTKQVSIDSEEKNSIFIYESSKTIFIKNQKFSFSDILSCNIEKVLLKRGTETHTTTPDKYEMAQEQALWGMGKKYNVKSTTVVSYNPDQYQYVVYIGIRSISNPQIRITFNKQSAAYEVKNIFDVIMNMSNDTQ